MIGTDFEVLRIRYRGPEYWKLDIMWWSHDGTCCTSIVEKNKKIMNKDFKDYREISDDRS